MFWTLNMYLYYGSRPSADSRPQHPSIHPSIHPSFYYLVLSIVLFFLFIVLSFSLLSIHPTFYFHLSIYLSIYLSGLLSDVCLLFIIFCVIPSMLIGWWHYDNMQSIYYQRQQTGKSQLTHVYFTLLMKHFWVHCQFSSTEGSHNSFFKSHF